MVNLTLTLVAAGIGVLCFASLYRAILGPTAADRVVAIGAITTKTTITIALLAFLTDNSSFFDVALVFGLCNFVATLCIARFLFQSKSGRREENA